MTGQEAYVAGKAHGGDVAAVKAAWAMHRGRSKGAPIEALYFAWGTIVGAAQRIDPRVNHRSWAVNLLLAEGIISLDPAGQG